MNRRDFMTLLGVAGGGTVAAASLAHAGVKPANPDPHVSDVEMNGVLIDTTRCVGCRTCETECAAAKGLPAPDDDDAVLDKRRDTTPTAATLINRFEGPDGAEVFVKKQCMHCNQPACASACLVSAMRKDPSGPVTWDERKCMGCRYCMVSCPFDVPKFEYDSPVPKILKCDMCLPRQKEGKQPVCVENCPEEALVFGKRRDLLEEARRRIYSSEPGTYHPQIYGEREVGGTGVLYLSAVPFEKLGFRTDLGEVSTPKHSRGFLYSVPFVFLIWPAALLGLRQATHKKKAVLDLRGQDLHAHHQPHTHASEDER